MRRLFPLPAVDDVDLEAAYAVPAGAGQHVRANFITSVDGAVTVEGVSGGLSVPADRRLFGVLRGLADVVLVGAGTVRREGYGPARPSAERQARRVAAGLHPTPTIAVVTGRLDLDLTSALFTESAARTVVVTRAAAPADRLGAARRVADVVVSGEERVDIAAALDQLAARGLRRVLCEGGPALLATVAAAGRLDELCLTVAPVLAAGTSGRLLAGPPLVPPRRVAVGHVLSGDGALFLRYEVDG